MDRLTWIFPQVFFEKEGGGIDVPSEPSEESESTVTDVEASQSNDLYDNDDLADRDPDGDSNSAKVVNDGTLTQNITAFGGTATTQDGIDGALGDANVGDDYSATGEADASADASAFGDMLLQDIEMGFNEQDNVFDLDIVGGDSNEYLVGGDDFSGEVGSDGANQDTTYTYVDVDQDNYLEDKDDIEDPLVLNDGVVDQFVTAEGGFATALDGIEIDGTNNLDIVAGDNASLSGSTNASADAVASAELIVQNIDTGGNEQRNTAETSIVGADQNVVSVGDDIVSSDPGVDLASSGDGSTYTEYESDQSNDLDDRDEINDPEVRNEQDAGTGFAGEFPPGSPGDGDSPGQVVTALGGEAFADDGIDIEIDVDIEATDDSVSLDGSSSASADATAVGDLITQNINTGGNLQVNSDSTHIVGGNKNVAEVGDTAEYVGTDPAEADAFAASWIDVDQDNDANDKDYIEDPEVVNEESGIGNEAAQLVEAFGGTATSSTGIDDDLAIGLDQVTAGDDISIDGSSSATADAGADGDLLTQDLDTGGNRQVNAVESSVVGADQNLEDIGGDDNSPVALTSEATGTAATDYDIEQDNELKDQDEIWNPEVRNEGDIAQTVTADGGFADTGDDGDGVSELGDANFTAGDNVDIDGSSSASADATAFAELITQDISTGGNGQLNSVQASIVGGNQNISDVGDDETASVETLESSGESSAFTDFDDVDQHNDMYDDDIVDDPLVENGGPGSEDAAQIVMATGGLAFADDGVEIDDDSDGSQDVVIDAGDSVSIDGSSSASADAVAVGDMLTQDIVTGRNGQANVFDASIVGGDQTDISVGDDGVLSKADTSDEDDDAATESHFDVEQSNWLDDEDFIDNPVVNNDAGDEEVPVSQEVTAIGGEVFAEDGVDLDDNTDVRITTGDDASVSGSTSASADATAVGELLTQELTTGGNAQTNEFDASIVGLNDTSISMGGDEISDQDAFESLGGGSDEFGTVSEFYIDQANSMYDDDTIKDAEVLNDGVMTQDVSALGGFAETQDGVEGTGEEDSEAGGTIIGTDVGDDLSIFGSASASADALAIGDLLTQDISMGANFQGNKVDIGIVGGSSTSVDIGEDNESIV